MNIIQCQQWIETAFTARAELSPTNDPWQCRVAVNWVFSQLDAGILRVAEPLDGQWIVHEWLKKAILLSFRLQANRLMPMGEGMAFDKCALKFANATHAEVDAHQVRLVPGAIVRYGAYLSPNAIMMPAFVNIGAYVGAGTMIDTWATVGSCAQIGANVHLSGGVGIGGVLEPLQAKPTIIEDNVFIGARSEIVEGVIIERNSVISMGVFIGQSTKIYDRETGIISYGRVPAGSVVVPGSLPSKDGCYSLNCAVIVKKVDEQTRAKTSLNDLLRN